MKVGVVGSVADEDPSRRDSRARRLPARKVTVERPACDLRRGRDVRHAGGLAFGQHACGREEDSTVRALPPSRRLSV
jgi:hypothetical protein